MEYFIGVDGGGTKTAFLLGNGAGDVLERLELQGSSYRQWGTRGTAELLARGVSELLTRRGVTPAQVCGATMGLPCYGENEKIDQELATELQRRFSPMPLFLVNDVVVGWAGSLKLQPGINIVAGTGAIAYGQNMQGETARCGGWDEFFSDEGSCYWLGRKTMELFSKQADGRLPKGALYRIVWEHFNLEHDYQFIEKVIPEVSSRRDAVAKLQVLLEKAALEGDGTATAAYEAATEELAMTVRGVKDALRMEAGCKVSYSGGLFRAGDLILKPFGERLAAMGCLLTQPCLPPVDGALLLARKEFGRNSGNT